MKYKINGIEYDSDKEPSVYDILLKLEKAELPLAVFVDGNVISRNNYKEIKIKNNNSVVIVTFLGGG